MANHQVFSGYFKAWRFFEAATEWVSDKQFQRLLLRVWNAMACARIRENIDELQSDHDELTAIVDELIAKKLDFSTAVSYEQAGLREHKVREVVYLMNELAAAVLEDADTSFCGYNQADAGLRASQSRDEDAAKAENANREREKEAKAEAEKKTKIEREAVRWQRRSDLKVDRGGCICHERIRSLDLPIACTERAVILM